LYQKPFADWADSIARSGIVLYTNVVYWEAIKSMSQLAALLSLSDKSSEYQQQAQSIKENIQQILWRPQLGFFATSENLDNLSAAGNLLAISWGLTEHAQSLSILEAIRERHMADPIPTQVASPPFHWYQIALENRLSRLGNYHTNSAWLWIGAWHIIAYAMTGDITEAQILLSRIAFVLIRDQQVHEVYGINGRPLSNFWYTSESPLIWNAAMVIYAINILEEYSSNQL
jgi:GH15 family glucan-1,4-alpha-glucosidase